MRSRDVAAYAATGLVAGALAGFFGVGGGILFVPALIYFYKMRPQDATMTSLSIIIPTGIVGAVTYHLGLMRASGEGLPWAVVGLVSCGSIVGTAVIGVPLAQRISGDALKRAFGVLLVIVALKMLLAPSLGEGLLRAHPVLVLAAGVVVGVASGFFGVGGGILAVPLLVMAFGLPQRLAQGASIAMAVPTALAGVIRAELSRKVKINYTAALVMAPLSMAAAGLGACFAGRTHDEALQKAFAVLLMVVGLRMAGLLAFLPERLKGSHTPDCPSEAPNSGDQP